jgi:hypothetical protein
MNQSTIAPIDVLPTKSGMCSVNELINNSIAIYKVFFFKLLGLQLVFLLLCFPSVAIITIMTWFYILHFVLIKLSTLLIVIIILVFIFIILAIMSQIGQLLILKEMSIEKGIVQYIKESLPLVSNYFYISLLFCLIVVLGVIAFIIPGIYLGIMYFLATLVFIFEGKTGISALKRSKELVKDYWWSVFGRLVAISAVFFIIKIALSIPTKFMGVDSLVYLFWNFFTSTIELIISPIVIIYIYFIYKDLVKIKGDSQVSQ